MEDYDVLGVATKEEEQSYESTETDNYKSGSEISDNSFVDPADSGFDNGDEYREDSGENGSAEVEFEEEERKIEVKTQPFFGPDKKYGACPICAAVIISPNEDTTAVCPNCHAELNLI